MGYEMALEFANYFNGWDSNIKGSPREGGSARQDNSEPPRLALADAWDTIHMSQQHARDLLPVIAFFAKEGRLPTKEEMKSPSFSQLEKN